MNEYQNDSIQLQSHSRIEYGGFWRRLGANILDGLILMPIAMFAVFFIFVSPVIGIFLSQMLIGLISASYATILHAKYGATWGKMAAGLTVRKLNMEAIGWDEAIKRSSVDYLLIFLNTIGNITTFLAIPREDLASANLFDVTQLMASYQTGVFVFIQIIYNLWVWGEVVVLLFNSKRRAIHDFIAGTVVVVADSVPNKILIKADSVAA